MRFSAVLNASRHFEAFKIRGMPLANALRISTWYKSLLTKSLTLSDYLHDTHYDYLLITDKIPSAKRQA